jgi:hypothetical protein
VFWAGDPASASELPAAGVKRIYAPPAQVEVWKKQGVTALPESSLKEYTTVPPPKTQMRNDVAAATSVPWVDANGWRYNRGQQRAFYSSLPPGSAGLAAAEAHAYGVDAVLAPDAADLPALRSMLAFLAKAGDQRLPVMANIGVVDDGSPALGEVLNLLGRRNLTYRVVKDKAPHLDLLVRLGSKDFPAEAAANPNDFAARVREKLTDDKRLLRVYGSYTVIGHLTGDASKGRLYLLNYGRNPARDVHFRVLGSYSRVRVLDSADPKLQHSDFSLHRGGTEFTIPVIQTYTIID